MVASVRAPKRDLTPSPLELKYNPNIHYTAAVVQNWLTARSVQVLHRLPYSLNLASLDFLLFGHVNSELAVDSLDLNNLRLE